MISSPTSRPPLPPQRSEKAEDLKTTSFVAAALATSLLAMTLFCHFAGAGTPIGCPTVSWTLGGITMASGVVSLVALSVLGILKKNLLPAPEPIHKEDLKNTSEEALGTLDGDSLEDLLEAKVQPLVLSDGYFYDPRKNKTDYQTLKKCFEKTHTNQEGKQYWFSPYQIPLSKEDKEIFEGKRPSPRIIDQTDTPQ